MKSVLLALLGLATFAAICAFAGLEASGAPEPVVAHRDSIRRPHVVEPVADALMTPQRAHLAQYVLDVIESWPAGNLPTVAKADLAYDIARAALDKPSSDPSQDAVLLAALAYFEGARFARYVASGQCNNADWRKWGVEEQEHMARGKRVLSWNSKDLMLIGGDCDGGRAHTLWQIHPAVDPSGPLYAACKLDVIASDQRDAAFCALSIAREDPSLSTYTGGQMGKAEERLAFARKAIAAHPFK
jgi:hypothetical protein